jgi:hypothetical protein
MSLGELAELMPLTSAIQDAKRAAIQGKPPRWPDQMEAEFRQLEARAPTAASRLRPTGGICDD